MQLHGKQIKNNTVTQEKLSIVGEFNLDGVRITNLESPENPYDAANKQYVDAIAQGLLPKDSCRIATTSSDELIPWDYHPGETDDYWTQTDVIVDIDGETLTDGDRILIKNATDKRGNGIWVYNYSESRLNRAEDANNIIGTSPVIENSEVRPGMFTFITKGTLNKTTGWVLKETDTIPTQLGVEELRFAQFSGAGTVTAGDAIEIDGTEISVKFDNDTIGLDGGGNLEVKDDSITPEKLSVNLEGNALSIQGSPNQLNVLVDDSTIEINVNNKLQVSDGGITSTQIENAAITNDKIEDGTITKDKLAFDVGSDLGGDALEYSGTPSKLNVKVDNSTIEIEDDQLQIKDGGITNDKLADGTIEKDKLAFDVADDLDGEGLSYSGTPTKLNVNVDDSTIEIENDILQIKDAGISEDKLSDSSVTTNKIANESIDGDKLNTNLIGAGLSLDGTPKILNINVDGLTIEINGTTNQLEIKEGGIDSVHIANNAITVDKLDISSVFGDGFEISGTPEQVNIKTADNSVNVGVEGIKAATLYRERFDGSNIDEGSTGATNFVVASIIPAVTSDISVYVNGLLEEFKWGIDDGTFCFKSSDGSTTRDKGEVIEGDVLHYKGTNYALETSDKLDIVYSALQ